MRINHIIIDSVHDQHNHHYFDLPNVCDYRPISIYLSHSLFVVVVFVAVAILICIRCNEICYLGKFLRVLHTAHTQIQCEKHVHLLFALNFMFHARCFDAVECIVWYIVSQFCLFIMQALHVNRFILNGLFVAADDELIRTQTKPKVFISSEWRHNGIDKVGTCISIKRGKTQMQYAICKMRNTCVFINVWIKFVCATLLNWTKPKIDTI